MSLPGDLANHLLGNSALTALIADRLWPQRLPNRESLPALTYKAIAGPRDFSHDGPALANPTYQISAYGSTYLQARQVAEAAAAAMHQWKAAYGCPAFAGDVYDLPSDAEAGVYAAAVDVEIWHR